MFEPISAGSSAVLKGTKALFFSDVRYLLRSFELITAMSVIRRILSSSLCPLLCPPEISRG